jgi:hypothetical protein
MALRQRLGERIDARRVLHHVDRPDRPPRRDIVGALGLAADDPEVGEPEVLHGARRGADVARLERLDQDDADVHCAVIMAARVIPSEVEESPEIRRRRLRRNGIPRLRSG